MDALTLFGSWRKKPANVPVGDKYLVLKIENNQNGNGPSGEAINIRGIIKLVMPKTQREFPHMETFDYAFQVSTCEPGNAVFIPMRIEGIPWMEAELYKLLYKHRGDDKDLEEWRGNGKHAFNYVQSV